MSSGMLTAIVVDDEDNTRNLMLRILKDYIPEINVIANASNAKEGLRTANEKHPDVLFLDVEMPGGTGINLAEGLNYSPFIVFVTAHEHYAIKAIKAGAFDYLLKPVDIDDLIKTVEKIVAKKNNTQSTNTPISETKSDSNHTLAMPVKEGMLYIKEQDILKLEADGAYTTIYLISGEKHLLSKNLKEVSEHLNASNFFRCHASFVINLKCVKKLIKTDGLFVMLSDNSTVPISRKLKDEFNLIMDKFRFGDL